MNIASGISFDSTPTEAEALQAWCTILESTVIGQRRRIDILAYEVAENRRAIEALQAQVERWAASS